MTEMNTATQESNPELDRDGLIDLACEHLGATRYAGDTLFAFVDEESPGYVYMHTDEDMVDLGTRIARGDDDIYACWTYDRTGVEIAASDIARNLFAYGTRELDPGALRTAAGAAGDIDTVAAMDHIADAVAEALAELWARHDFAVETEQ